jgi:hypothetical protein
MLSCRLAPDSVTPSGVPSRSTTRWRFEPGLPRSVGFGPICDPPFWPQRSHRPASRGSSRDARHRPAVPEARGAADPRRRPPASRASAASTSCPSSQSRQAASPTQCRTPERTRSQPARPDRRGAGARPSVETAAAATRARSTPTTHRKREVFPSAVNARNTVLLRALIAAHCPRVSAKAGAVRRQEGTVNSRFPGAISAGVSGGVFGTNAGGFHDLRAMVRRCKHAIDPPLVGAVPRVPLLAANAGAAPDATGSNPHSSSLDRRRQSERVRRKDRSLLIRSRRMSAANRTFPMQAPMAESALPCRSRQDCDFRNPDVRFCC